MDNREFGDSHPVAADWDGDELLDLLVAHSEGGVLWYRNTGSPNKPKLDKAVKLIPNSPSPWTGDSGRRPDDWGVRAKICVVDWNQGIVRRVAFSRDGRYFLTSRWDGRVFSVSVREWFGRI